MNWIKRTGLPMVLTITAAILLAHGVADAATWEWHWAHTHCLDIFWWLR